MAIHRMYGSTIHNMEKVTYFDDFLKVALLAPDVRNIAVFRSTISKTRHPHHHHHHHHHHHLISSRQEAHKAVTFLNQVSFLTF